MRRDGIDIVHTHLFGDSLHGFIAAKRSGDLPVVMTLHNARENFSRLQLWAYRHLLPRCARVVACSPSARNSFADIVDGKAVYMCTIANGFDAGNDRAPDHQEIAALKSTLGIPPGARVIGAIGRMVEQKGFNYLITAIGALSQETREEVRLVLLGTGADLPALMQQAQDEGIVDLVLFPGFRSDAREILGIFDVVAFPSLFEGLPVALLEAMAAATCIVASDIDSLSEVLSDDVNALLVPPRDPHALATAIGRVLADATLCKRLRSAAKELYRERFTAARMVQDYVALYRSIIDGEREALRLPTTVRKTAEESY